MAQTKTFIKEFINKTKNEIIELASLKLANSEKKEKLDIVLTAFVENFILKANINVIFKFILKKLILPHVSELTQGIYDLLKAKISEITTNKEIAPNG